MAGYGKGRDTPAPLGPKARKPTRMMGSTGDSRAADGGPNLKGYHYTGSRNGGKWNNANGVIVGRSDQEDSEITPYKSTGDTGAVAKYISQRKKAGTKGY